MIEHAADHLDRHEWIRQLLGPADPTQQHIFVNSRHHHAGDDAVKTANAGRLQRTRPQLSDFDRFLAVFSKVVVADTP